MSKDGIPSTDRESGMNLDGFPYNVHGSGSCSVTGRYSQRVPPSSSEVVQHRRKIWLGGNGERRHLAGFLINKEGYLAKMNINMDVVSAWR